jgi:hypothetical protein
MKSENTNLCYLILKEFDGKHTGDSFGLYLSNKEKIRYTEG